MVAALAEHDAVAETRPAAGGALQRGDGQSKTRGEEQGQAVPGSPRQGSCLTHLLSCRRTPPHLALSMCDITSALS